MKLTVESTILKSLKENAANLLEEYIGLKNEVNKRFVDLHLIAGNVIKEVKSICQELSTHRVQSTHYKELYRKESLQRKILYNKVIRINSSNGSDSGSGGNSSNGSDRKSRIY